MVTGAMGGTYGPVNKAERIPHDEDEDDENEDDEDLGVASVSSFRSTEEEKTKGGKGEKGRKNRFKFLNFKESLGNVHIDVYRTTKHVSVNPKTGDNFLHDALQEYRELCLHKAFLDVHSTVFPLCQSLSQVVYHKKLLFQTIVQQVTIENKLSLEALMVLISSMARDLQGDFMEFVEPLFSVAGAVLIAGGSQDATVIENVFTGLFQVCKYLVRQLCGDMEHFTRSSMHLLYYKHDHIRKFAADMMSFVFRNASLDQVQAGLLILLEEREHREGELGQGIKIEAVALLLVNSLLSTREHLHSKAGSIFEMLFKLAFSTGGASSSLFQAKAVKEGAYSRNAVSCLALLTLHKLYQRNKRMSLGMPMHLLSEHVSILVTFEANGENVGKGREDMIAWSFKTMNMILGKSKEENLSDDVADLYSRILENFLKLNARDVFKAGGGKQDQFSSGAEVLEEQYNFKSDNWFEGSAPALLPEFFLLMCECVNLLQNCQAESYSSSLGKSSDLLRKWIPAMPLSSVVDFCDILTLILHRSPSLTEPLAPVAFRMIKEKLQGDSPLSLSCDNTGIATSIDLLTRAYNLHVVSASAQLEVFKGISELLVCTVQELVSVETDHISKGHAKDVQVKFFPIFYLIMRLVQRLDNAEHRFLVGKLVYTYIKGFKMQNEEILVLLSEAAKTALVSASKFIEMQDVVKEIFSSAGRLVDKIPLLGNLIWILDFPLLPEGKKEELCSFLSSDSWNQLIFNLRDENKAVRIKTIELLSKCGFFHYKGELHEDSDFLFGDILATFERKFTVNNSRAVANKIRRFALDIEYLKLDKKYMPIFGNIFVGQLNESFSELWEPCVHVLKELLSKAFNATFGTVWDSLMHCHNRLVRSGSPDSTSKYDAKSMSNTFDLDLHDDSFGSHNAKSATADPVKYKLLVSALKGNNEIWSKQSEVVVATFLEFSEAVCKGSVDISSQQSNDILFEWVGILDSITNIHKMEAGPALKVKLEALLSKVSPQIQVQILKSLRSWKVPVVSSRVDILIQACNVKTEKDLHPFQTSHNTEKGLSQDERVVLVPLLLRILFPKMKRRKMRLTSRRSQGTARKTILHFLTCFNPSELQLLHELFIQPMLTFGNRTTKWTMSQLLDPEPSLVFIQWWDTKHIPLNVQAGFLDSFKDFLSCLGKHMKDYIFPWMNVTLCFLKTLCVSGKEHLQLQQQDPCAVLSLSLDIVTEIFQRYEDLRFSEMLDFIEDSLQSLMRTEYFQNYQVFDSLVSFVKTIMTSDSWSKEVDCHKKFVAILDILFESLQTYSGKKKKALFNFVDSILEDSPKSSSSKLEKYYPCFLSEVKEMDFKADRRSEMIFTLNIVQKMSDLFSEKIDTFETVQILMGSLKWFNNRRVVMKNEMLLRSTLRVAVALSSSYTDTERSEAFPLVASDSSLLSLVNMFLCVPQNDLRVELCTILETVLKGYSISNQVYAKEVAAFSKLCQDLNALSTSTIGEIDYDLRLGAYSKMQAIRWRQLGELRSLAQTILLHQCVYDLAELEDFSMQQASSEALKRLISDSRDGGQFDSEYRENTYTLLKRGIHNKKDSVRKEFLHLMSHLFLEFPDDYKDMVILSDEDQEQDFFKNVTHLQLHRRVRAVNKLGSLIRDGLLGKSAIVDVVVPVLMGFICDTTAASLGGTMSNLVDICIECLGVACKVLEWSSVRNILNRFLRILKIKNAQSKSIMRAITSTLSFCEGVAHDAEANVQEILQAQQDSEPIQYIYKILLPYLSRLFYQDKDPPSHLVAALAQVLKVMPENLTKIEMPQLIQRLSSRLKIDMQSSRENTRAAMCAMLDVSGYKYLSYVINSIDSTLMNRGVQGYIKCYSVYYLLKSIENKLPEGEIDDHLNAFFEIFSTDIFGEVAQDRQERKESEKLFKKSFKEGLRCYSLSTFQLVTSLMNVEDSLQAVIEFVESNFTPDEKRVKVVRKLFECLAQGITSNKSISHQYLLVLFYGMIEDLNESLASQVDQMESFQTVFSISTPQLLNQRTNSTSDSLLLELKAEFTLSVLWKFIKSGRLHEGLSKEQYLQLLNPWSALLIPVLKSRRSSLVVLALKCLNRIYLLPLKTNTEYAASLSKQTFVVMRKSPRLADSSSQECLKLLTVLLKHYTKYSPTNTQLNFLMRLVAPDIEKTENQNGIFSFLKAIISRGIVIPSVYDLMDKVSMVMISSGSDSTRRTAGQVFLQYLLDYPMNDNRRKHHLEFVIKNCDFAHETGRLSMLELILSVLRKFPEDIIQDLGEMFLFPLVLRVCNDESTKCKALAADALVVLLSRSKEEFRRNAYGLSLQWLRSERIALKAAGCQLILHMKKGGSVSSERQNVQVTGILTEQLKVSILEEKNATLKYLCFALTLLEVILQQRSEHEEVVRCQAAILGMMESLLLVPNVAVKTLGTKVMKNILVNSCKRLHADLDMFQRLFKVLVNQLQEDINETFGDDLIAPMAALVKEFHIDSIPVRESDRNNNFPLDQDLSSSASPSGREIPELPDYFHSLRRVMSLASGNTTMGRPATRDQQSTALRVVLLLVESLSPDRLREYLPSFMIPIYHVKESKAAVDMRVQELANDLVDKLDGIMGNETVALAYNEARKFVVSKRTEKRQSEKIQKLVDPEKAARASIKRNLKRKISRKRKKAKSFM